MRFYYYLLGMIELKKENFTNAIKLFHKAMDLVGFQVTYDFYDSYLGYQVFFHEPLAFAYYKSGDLEAAIEEYRRIISLTYARLDHGDIYAKSFYMLGKIYEDQGETAKAIDHYEKFLTLWKDADPGIAEVEEAKKRLAGLRGN